MTTFAATKKLLVNVIGPDSMVRRADRTTCGAYGITRVKSTVIVSNPVTINLMADARAYWKILTQSHHCPAARRNLPVPAIVTRQLNRDGYKGFYRPGTHTVHISLTHGLDVAMVRSILLHELAHAATGKMDDGRDVWHGKAWRDLYQDAAERLWGFTCTSRPRHRYGLDDLIVAHLRSMWNIVNHDRNFPYFVKHDHPDLARITGITFRTCQG